MSVLLETDALTAGYGKKTVLRGIALALRSGEIVALIGHNGSAKTTTLKAIFGLVPIASGTVKFEGQDVTKLATFEKVHLGMAFVPQGKGVFPNLTVKENLLTAGSGLSDEADLDERVETATAIFPVLRERFNAHAHHLSGGEQQMLALSIALMLRPKLLLLDEPSVGLSPVMIEKVFQGIRLINSNAGTTILLAEQNVRAALGLVQRVYVLKLGQVVREGTSTEIARQSVWDLF